MKPDENRSTQTSRHIAAVVLAAGGSSRLGTPKQLLHNAFGHTLVHQVAQEAIECGAQPVVVVVGASASDVRAAVANLAVTTIENDLWSEGLSSSIRAGVQVVSLLDSPPDGILLVACDMPSVGVEHLRALRRAFDNGVMRVASSYGETVGIPAIIPHDEWDDLLELAGDRGAKSILRRDDTQTIPLTNGHFDLDTPDDVARWRAER